MPRGPGTGGACDGQLRRAHPIAVFPFFALLRTRGAGIPGAALLGSHAFASMLFELSLTVEMTPAGVAAILVRAGTGWCWHNPLLVQIDAIGGLLLRCELCARSCTGSGHAERSKVVERESEVRGPQSGRWAVGGGRQAP